MLLECAVLQECRDEYNTVDSLNALFETVPETCIVELLREVGFFYLIWCNLLTSTSPETLTTWSDFSNLFRDWKQLWGTFTHVGRLICPEGRVSSLNKSNPTKQWRGSLMSSFMCTLNKQSQGWWFETPSPLWWCNCNGQGYATSGIDQYARQKYVARDIYKLYTGCQSLMGHKYRDLWSKWL